MEEWSKKLLHKASYEIKIINDSISKNMNKITWLIDLST